jgi:hypothetical protein
MNWIDGTLDTERISGALGRHPHLSVLHGHTHRRQDRRLGDATHPRVFSPTSVVQDASPLRVYDVEDRALIPVELRSRGAGQGLDGRVGALLPAT